MMDKYTQHISKALNVVERDDPNLGVVGQHTHTMDNPYGLHFHADGTLGGAHTHNDKNLMGVHTHGTDIVLSGGHFHSASAAGNKPSDGSHGHLDDDSPELREKISSPPALASAPKRKLQFNDDGTVGFDQMNDGTRQEILSQDTTNLDN